MLIDMHSHILPEADHGSDSIETSLDQLSRAKKAGVDVILATPHFYHHKDNVDAFLARRKRCFNNLKEALHGTEYEDIPIYLGAEVTLEVDLVDNERLPELCIEGTNRLLLEMPVGITWTEWIYNSVYLIAAKHNVKPIIAHIDRYEQKQTERLLEMGVDAQINAPSLCSILTRPRIMKYVKTGSVKFLGSDIHGANSKEYDCYAKAVKVLGHHADYIMHNSARVLGLVEAEEDSSPDLGGFIL